MYGSPFDIDGNPFKIKNIPNSPGHPFVLYILYFQSLCSELVCSNDPTAYGYIGKACPVINGLTPSPS